MNEWHVEIIPAAEREIRALSAEMQARFLDIANMLERLGPYRVGEPHVRHLGDKL